MRKCAEDLLQISRTNMRSVGVMGDFRTYDYAVALRAVKTIDKRFQNINLDDCVKEIANYIKSVQ